MDGKCSLRTHIISYLKLNGKHASGKKKPNQPKTKKTTHHKHLGRDKCKKGRVYNFFYLEANEKVQQMAVLVYISTPLARDALQS